LIATILKINGGGLLDLNADSGTSVPAALASSLLFLLVFDFFYYWWHRAQHEVPALWAFHKLHHMDESLGVSTQMRCHWLEEIGRIPSIFMPMALLFNLPLHAGVVAFVLTAWGAFIHANLRLGLGKASAVVAGPQVHRIHHSILAQHFDKNYAAFFPLYDVLFRTYYHPAPDEYPPTGVRDDPEINSVVQAFLLPFQTWARGNGRAKTSVSSENDSSGRISGAGFPVNTVETGSKPAKVLK
jgi:sterol desaturase/sphingolipid hydroxylase (fatty acid hydroxylase superfamily)